VLSEDEGRRVVRHARVALDAGIGPAPRPAEDPAGADVPPFLREPRGAFVTLKRYPSGDLRGCIGYPLPVLPLGIAIARAAVAAATEDPRFPPVRSPELPALTVEVSVLSVPVPVRGRAPEEIVRAIRAGRDGLIAEGYGTSGLLLPQVASEMGWSSEELLEGTCAKARLPPGAWRDPAVRLRRFEAEVFGEPTPGGAAERRAA
jgi:uncharacterized protein